MLESRSETVVTVETAETVLTEDLKKVSVTYSVTDSLKARDASASKKKLVVSNKVSE